MVNFSVTDVHSSAGTFFLQLLDDVLKSVLLAAVLAALGWFTGPLKWLWKGHRAPQPNSKQARVRVGLQSSEWGKKDCDVSR